MLEVKIGLALVAGLIVAISPCVLPVLPIVLAGGTVGSRRRPFAIVGGLLASFLVSILFAVWILDQLGLPGDLLRNISIGLLFLVAATLVVPPLGVLVERPLARLSRGPKSDLGGGFLLGCALGFVFVPCGGTVLASITAATATGRFDLSTVVVAVAYTVGAGIVLLLIAVGGRTAANRIRTRVDRLRAALGIVVAAVALTFVFDLDVKFQHWLPGWTNFLQAHTENSAYARSQFDGTGNVTAAAPARRAQTPGGLPDYGPAPDFTGNQAWLNTPGGRPLTLKELRGKVVLVDFWTYSCINCLRTLPYLEAWYRRYAKDGFVIVGVHTPEFAFEHEVSNVRQAVHEYGVRYPVAIDNAYATWKAYRNAYWPAEYLLDSRGHVREAKFGEGDYSKTENAIRSLLAERDASLPKAVHLADHTPDYAETPESYLGTDRLDRYGGTPIDAGRMARYTLPFVLEQSQLAYGGSWRVGPDRAVSGPDARLRLHFVARKVHLVLGGTGFVDVLLNGKAVGRVHVTQDRLYTLVDQGRDRDGLLELRFTPGLSAYAFTFG
jgi:cytochrome c biogenesis protein CcdA/thiol-disulfide isomerase/thioredoxin